MRPLLKWRTLTVFVLGVGVCAAVERALAEVGPPVIVNKYRGASDGTYQYEFTDGQFTIKVDSGNGQRLVFSEPMDENSIWVARLSATRIVAWFSERSKGLMRVLDLAGEVKTSPWKALGIYDKILSLTPIDVNTFRAKVSYRYISTIGVYNYRRSVWTYTVGDDLVISGVEKIVCNGSFFPGHDDWRNVPYCVVQAYNGIEEP